MYGYNRIGVPVAGAIALRDFVMLPSVPILTIIDFISEGSHMAKTKKHITATILVEAALSVLLVLRCKNEPPTQATNSSHASTPPASPPVNRIRIATSKNLWCALTLIADKEGYFAVEGLSPELNYQAAGCLNMDALLGDAADVANVVETNIAYQAMNRTPNLAVIGHIVTATDYTIITKKSAHIARPSDLRGKRIAYAQATGAESFLFWFLEHHSIPIAAVTLVPLQPSGLVDHFLGESTEAVVSWEPFASAIRTRLKDLGSTYESDPRRALRAL